jgi:N-methylhydantoinase A
MPFGGAGPTHANMLAEEARLSAVLVPFAASTFCALGAILADVKRDFVRSLRIRLLPPDDAATAKLHTALTELSAEARAWIAGEADSLRGHTLSATAEMRYAGQSFELTVDWDAATFAHPTPDAIAELFHRVHEGVYGFRDTTSAVELTALRVRVTGHVEPIDLPDALPLPAAEPLGIRPIFGARGWGDWPVHDRGRLGRGARIAGPAIIEQEDSTLVLLPGWRAEVDLRGNLELRRG